MSRDHPGGRSGRASRRGVLAPAAAALLRVVVVSVAAAVGPARAELDPAAEVERTGGGSGAWLSVGLLGGTTQLSRGLADYQWSTTPRPAWGAQVLAGGNRFAAGLRLGRTQTAQAMGDMAMSATVRATSWEVVGEGFVAEAWGTRLLARACMGWLHLGFHPDQVTIQATGSSGPIVVDLVPVDEWIAGGGLGLRRPLGSRWTLGFAIDARAFGLETAHRAGQTVVVERGSFGDWSARVELGRLYRRR